MYLQHRFERNRAAIQSPRKPTPITEGRDSWDDWSVSTYRPYFVFGKDVIDDDRPLESMSAKSALCGVRAYDRLEMIGSNYIYF